MTERTKEPVRHDRGMVAIAAFKMVKAVLLLALGLGAIGVVHAGIASVAARLLATFSTGTERHLTEQLVARASRMSPGRIEALGVGAFLFAILFSVEAVGLWLQRRWGEYLTIVATASFIPFEIYELARDVTAIRIAALAINIAVVIYLIVRLRRKSK